MQSNIASLHTKIMNVLAAGDTLSLQEIQQKIENYTDTASIYDALWELKRKKIIKVASVSINGRMIHITLISIILNCWILFKNLSWQLPFISIGLDGMPRNYKVA